MVVAAESFYEKETIIDRGSIMCTRVSPMQLGEPLTEEMLRAMNAAEAEFWDDFLTEARTVLDLREAERAAGPYEPTASLSAKYCRAVNEFDGGRYCPVRQLEGLFKFSATSSSAI